MQITKTVFYLIIGCTGSDFYYVYVADYTDNIDISEPSDKRGRRWISKRETFAP